MLQHENEAKLLHLLPVISILFCHPIVRKCLILVSNVSEYLFMIFNRLSPAFLYLYTVSESHTLKALPSIIVEQKQHKLEYLGPPYMSKS